MLLLLLFVAFVNSKIGVLILEKNKKDQYVGKSPYNQTVILDEKVNTNQKYLNKMKHVIGQKLEVTITRAFQNSLEGRLSSESFS